MSEEKKNHKRIGSALEHGEDHCKDHAQWSRRNFLVNSGILTAAMSMPIGGHYVSAFNTSELTMSLNAAETDRVVVLIRLDGGNDGLNTIIPRFDPTYYNSRPTLSISESELTPLDNDNGLNNDMASLMPHWNDGRMGIIHNVGYPDPDYSHFRSSDIWATASDSDEHWTTGWIGRYTDNLMPAFIDAPPVVPPALQIGVQSNLIFRGPEAAMALTINNPEEFYSVALTGELYSTAGLTSCPKDLELAFMRQTANSAFRYSESIQDAYNAAPNGAGAYPVESELSEALSIVGRLIRGRLGTKIYMVSIGGFDTHDTQVNDHPSLIQELADSVNAFLNEINDAGMSEEVLVMTFSEFGRTYAENDSFGTDHGTGAPVFIFGDGIANGIHGDQPDLSSLGPYDDPGHDTDFRSLYATVLKDWLCVDESVVNYVMGNEFSAIPGLVPACTPSIGANDIGALLGHNPNANNPANIDIKYAVKTRGLIRLQLLNLSGQVLRTLLTEYKEEGSHIYNFSPAAFGVTPGNYMYKLDAAGMSFTRKLKI